MVMFTETRAQQIAENGLLSTEEKIAQLCDLDARLDASKWKPRWPMRSARKSARLWGLSCLRRVCEKRPGVWLARSPKGEIVPFNVRAQRHPQWRGQDPIECDRFPLVDYRYIKPSRLPS